MHRRIITATAPIRICDLGGWTDTWFAGRGVVCSLTVNPGIEVRITLTHREKSAQTICVEAHNYNQKMVFPIETVQHPLLHAAISSNPIPHEYDAYILVRSDIPPGCSTGTSAALSVALIGGLRAVHRQVDSAAQLAHAAHQLETVALQQQSGIQDQIGAAYGGCVAITMDRYPEAQVTNITLAPATTDALNRQLLLYYVGTPHLSTQIHGQVIERFVTFPDTQRILEPLRQAARAGAAALRCGDLVAYGAALSANTQAQRGLHPGLVSSQAEALIALAVTHGAYGCKVNGAGGDGGSVAVLTSSDENHRQSLRQTIARQLPQMQNIPIALSAHGVRITETQE